MISLVFQNPMAEGGSEGSAQRANEEVATRRVLSKDGTFNKDTLESQLQGRHFKREQVAGVYRLVCVRPEATGRRSSTSSARYARNIADENRKDCVLIGCILAICTKARRDPRQTSLLTRDLDFSRGLCSHPQPFSGFRMPGPFPDRHVAWLQKLA